ncbi:RNA polymerase-associated protein RapA [Opitutaceae bacterium TAV4]|nr:RNA polymerase-associated protein RapA [Opitutaceae bacterium TAV4]
MSETIGQIGQRCMSEREPELGLGLVTSVDRAQGRIGVGYPATGESRLYALGTTVLKRVRFNPGDTLTTRDGATLNVESVEEDPQAPGLLVYLAASRPPHPPRRVREDELSDITSISSPPERLLAGQVEPGEVFDLRLRTLQAQARFRQSDVRGYLGGRLELIPHQIYILNEVSSRQIPRVLLSDEVGLGKTIEACLILQRLLAIGKASRVLILVPESLTHQWFVELLRRFNLWFSIYDEERCLACEQSAASDNPPPSPPAADANTDGQQDRQPNPFLAAQLVLCSIGFLTTDARRRDQTIAAGWDIVVVDEAHHLEWTPELASPAYTLVEQLSRNVPGLLLLTATPRQLGQAGHFARLRLLDPHRYSDYEQYLRDTEGFTAIAAIAEKIVGEPTPKPLTAKDHATLKKIFTRDPAGLAAHLEALAAGRPGAREALLRTLLDQHGTGRVVFRNTRAAMTGFPKRHYCPIVLPLPSGAGVSPAGRGVACDARARHLMPSPANAGFASEAPTRGADISPADDSDADETPASLSIPLSPAALLARDARELLAEETTTDALRYNLKHDPRIAWLADLLQKHRPAKVLLICKTRRKAIAIADALQEQTITNTAIKTGLFHEDLPLVQRDRNAAWFAEPDGAQLLICSEIGSEGRNFQFAHHLVLFDLPLNPGLLEQRIGRLDRIGQTQTIRIHVPLLAGSATERLADWYHRGLDAFESPLHGGAEYERQFRNRLLELLPPPPPSRTTTHTAAFATLITDTIAFRKALTLKMRKGRDRLLELNSFNPAVAERVIERIREVDADPFLRRHLLALLDHFDVRIKEDENGDVFFDPSHAYVEAFPSIPRDGMLATFDRRRAIAREDIRFLSADHPLVQDAADLLIDSATGTTAFCLLDAPSPKLPPNLLLEAVFVLEAVADTRWHLDQFLAPTPIRVLIDIRGNDLTDQHPAADLADQVRDGVLPRFLERPGFNAALLKKLHATAAACAGTRTTALKTEARDRAAATLTASLQRLVDLQKLNDHVRPEEIALATTHRDTVLAAIDQARLRLDSLRLIVQAPAQ